MSLTGQETFFEVLPPLPGPDREGATPEDQLLELNGAIRFLCYSMLESLSDLASNNLPYGIPDE